MIVPCIDLQDGRAVQLVRGRHRKLAVADVMGLLQRFCRYRVIHVIDLDAAMRRGSNARLVRTVCRRALKQGIRVRVGGGIRTVARARRIIGWGADKVIIGSAAFRRGQIHHAFLRRLVTHLGKRHIIIALDSERGCIVIRGWRRRLCLRPRDVIEQMQPYASEFLCTYVDREGTMRGTSLSWFRKLRRLTKLRITAAGGVRSHREVRALARLGMKAAVGMALYLDQMAD